LLGAFSQGITIVTAHDTLGSEGLQHSISESEASLLFMNTDQLPTLQKILNTCPSIHTIIYRGDPASPEIVQQLTSHKHIHHVLSFQELIDVGKAHPSEVRTPSADDLCCIMYTSGSTGNPKGVMLTHGNVVASIAGICCMLQHLIDPSDSMIAYLPLAHVLEFIVEHVCIFLGVPLGYGSVRTLTNGSVKNCMGDLQAFQPTLMTGVPQVWESIKKTALTSISDRGSRVQRIFSGAFWFKKYLADHHLPSGFLNKMVFDNIKKQVGGRLRYCISAGAPVSPETQEFLTLAVSPLLVVYGMTESCG
jgi:long-chain acyl-CoA synthetase